VLIDSLARVLGVYEALSIDDPQGRGSLVSGVGNPSTCQRDSDGMPRSRQSE
jgi:hypothetical protein